MQKIIFSLLLTQVAYSQYKNIFTGATTLEPSKNDIPDDKQGLYNPDYYNQPKQTRQTTIQNTQSYNYLFEDSSPSNNNQRNTQNTQTRNQTNQRTSTTQTRRSYQYDDEDDEDEYEDDDLQSQADKQTKENLQRILYSLMGVDIKNQNQMNKIYNQNSQNQSLSGIFGQGNSNGLMNLLSQPSNQQNQQQFNFLNQNALQNQQQQNQNLLNFGQNGNLLQQQPQQNQFSIQNLLQTNSQNQNNNTFDMSTIGNLLGLNQQQQTQNFQNQNNLTQQPQQNNNLNSLFQLYQQSQPQNQNQQLLSNTTQQQNLFAQQQQQNNSSNQQNMLLNNNFLNQLFQNNSQNQGNQFSNPTQTLNPANCSCPMTMQIVCGQNGKTYTNQCYAQCEGTNVQKQGACFLQSTSYQNINQNIIRESNQQVLGASQNCAECSQKIEPVCGMNNKLYRNRCLLQCEGIAMKKLGKC